MGFIETIIVVVISIGAYKLMEVFWADQRAARTEKERMQKATQDSYEKMQATMKLTQELLQSFKDEEEA